MKITLYMSDERCPVITFDNAVGYETLDDNMRVIPRGLLDMRYIAGNLIDDKVKYLIFNDDKNGLLLVDKSKICTLRIDK